MSSGDGFSRYSELHKAAFASPEARSFLSLKYGKGVSVLDHDRTLTRLPPGVTKSVQSRTADTLLSPRSAQSRSADTLLSPRSVQSRTADTLLSPRSVQSRTADTLLSPRSVQSRNADTLLSARSVQSHIADTFLSPRSVQSCTVDTLLSPGFTMLSPQSHAAARSILKHNDQCSTSHVNFTNKLPETTFTACRENSFTSHGDEAPVAKNGCFSKHSTSQQR